MMHTHWPWLWFVSNLLTGVSYVAIASVIVLERRVRVEYWFLFALFVSACGTHHLVHALPTLVARGAVTVPAWLDVLQMFVDATMMSLSVLTTVLVGRQHVADVMAARASRQP